MFTQETMAVFIPCIDPKTDASVAARKVVINDFFSKFPGATKADAVAFLLKFYPEISSGGHRGFLQRLYATHKPWEKPLTITIEIAAPEKKPVPAPATPASFKGKTCPKCGKYADTLEELDTLFGYRKVKGRDVPQSWCRKCR